MRENSHHCPLECSRRIAQAKWHPSVGECAIGTCERHLLHILRVDGYLKETGIPIKVAEVSVSR